MIQSEESRRLEEYARQLQGSYPDFVRSMAIGPQEDGIDKALWAYVEENQPDYDEFMAEYLILSGVYEGDDSAKELAQWMKEVVANQD